MAATAEEASAAARTWTVRELADELGVTTRTLRFYEAEGLISPARSGTQRVYGPRDRARLVLILRGRRFGMSLEESREIVDMYEDAASGERAQLRTLLARLDEIAEGLRERRRDLTHTLDEVVDVARQCRERLAELPDEPGDDVPPVPREEVPALPVDELPDPPDGELPPIPDSEVPETPEPSGVKLRRRVLPPNDDDPYPGRSTRAQERRRA